MSVCWQFCVFIGESFWFVGWRVVGAWFVKNNNTADLGGSSALLDEITKCYKGKASAAILMIGVVIFYRVEVWYYFLPKIGNNTRALGRYWKSVQRSLCNPHLGSEHRHDKNIQTKPINHTDYTKHQYLLKTKTPNQTNTQIRNRSPTPNTTCKTQTKQGKSAKQVPTFATRTGFN